MTFFHCANASKAVKLSSGKRVAFDVYHYFAGAWLGIAAVEDQETIDGLNELTYKPKSGITQISAEEYDRNYQKKNPPRNSRPSLESPLPPPRVSPPIDLVRGVAARLVEKAAEKPAEPFATPKVYDSIDEVLKIGVVKPLEQTVKVKVKPKAKEAIA